MNIVQKLKLKQDDFRENASVTIAFLGDSVTQGCFGCFRKAPEVMETYFDVTSAYSTRLREILALLYPKVQVNIINSGISGDNAVGGLKRIDRDVLSFHPDLVVVGFALNDCCDNEEGFNAYKNAIKEILEKVQKSGAECILLTPNMMCTQTSCHTNEELLINVSKWLSRLQNEGWLDKFVDAEIKIAKEKNVKVCDVYHTWKTLYNGGVDITELLANQLNHPIKDFHYYTAIKLLETIFEI